MAGMTKECSKCGANFQTTSMKSAMWEHTCHKCHGRRRQMAAERHTLKSHNNLESSLRREMESLALKVSNIDILISAEVSNMMQNMTDNDIYVALKTTVDNRLNSLETKMEEKLSEQFAKMEEENKKFREKIQKQILILNNKLVRVMQEREE